MRRAQHEQDIQRAVFAHLKLRAAPGVFAFHPANGGLRPKTEAAILQALGVRAGVPDIIAFRAGKAYALEIKTAVGKLTPAQRAVHAQLVDAGVATATTFGLSQSLARLEAWGLLRGRSQ